MTSSNFSKFHLPGLYGIFSQNKQTKLGEKEQNFCQNRYYRELYINNVSCILQPKMIFNKTLYNIETSQLVFDTDQLTYLKVFLSKLLTLLGRNLRIGHALIKFLSEPFGKI